MVELMHMRITKVSLLGYSITVYEKTNALTMGANLDITVKLRWAVGEPDENGVRLKPEGIATVLNCIPDVVAYEILDGNGHGAMVLKEPN